MPCYGYEALACQEVLRSGLLLEAAGLAVGDALRLGRVEELAVGGEDRGGAAAGVLDDAKVSATRPVSS